MFNSVMVAIVGGKLFLTKQRNKGEEEISGDKRALESLFCNQN